MSDENDPKKPYVKSSIEADELEFLSNAIVEDRAVLYIGSGVSKAANLPTWKELLLRLYNEGAKELLVSDKKSLDYLGEQIKSGNYIEAADLLQHVLDTDLEAVLWNIVQGATEPTAIHVNAARIPFQMALTTNYDLLLELAYSSLSLERSRPVLTWENPQAILAALKTNRRIILKLHGAIGNGPSLVLSTRQYRNLMYDNPLFRDIFEWILMTKTCLFVGAGLTDLDLLQTIHKAITRLGDDFGPHYALLPRGEAPPLRIQNLMKSLRIKAIALPEPEGERTLTDENARVLVDLGGQVAAKVVQRRPPPIPTSDEPTFYLLGALEVVLKQALRTTGAFRGDVCLSSDGIGSHLSGELKYARHAGPTGARVREQIVRGLSVCGIAYYSSDGGLYVPNVLETRLGAQFISRDVANPGRWLRSPITRLNVEYVEGHTDVRSELAVTITAEGVRVGVLNLESDQIDAFTDGHFTAARWFADKAGRLFAGALERDRRGSLLANAKVELFYNRLCGMFEKFVAFRQGSEIDPSHRYLGLLVYHVNYREGTIRAQDTDVTVRNPGHENKADNDLRHPKFEFGRPLTATPDKTAISLAAKVFMGHHALLCTDARKAAECGEIPKKYLKHLDISGPVLGFLAWVHGYVAGVVTVWSTRPLGELENWPIKALNWRDMELLQRSAHAVANGARLPGKPPEEELPELEGTTDDFRKDNAQYIARHIKEARGILNLFETSPADLVAPEDPTKVRPDMFEYWKKDANRIAALLAILQRCYGVFEDRFLVPRRARLWVRGKSPADQCRCALVLEVSFDGDKPDAKARVRNLFGDDKHVRITDPEERPSDSAKEDTLDLYCAKITVTGVDFKPVTGYDDRYLKFHLSRLNADRFVRLQWPMVLGDDPNADALDKHKDMPWYVAPILGVRDHPKPDPERKPEPEPPLASDAAAPKVTMLEDDRMRESVYPIAGALRTFIGYLTFDGGLDADGKPVRRDYASSVHSMSGTNIGNPSANQSPSRLLRPEEALLQNELAHKLDLFTACLAETPHFRAILDGLDKDQRDIDAKVRNKTTR